MNFARQQHQSHEITKHIGGSSVFCVWVPGTLKTLALMPLPCLDSGWLFGPGAFSPAARSPAGRGRLGTSYGTQGTVWEGRCTMGDGGSRPATRRCGGRCGASPFPAKGRRTWGSKARTSTRRSWGCDSRTWIG
jgi:hypothetical protein